MFSPSKDKQDSTDNALDKASHYDDVETANVLADVTIRHGNSDGLHRTLGNRQIQLVAIGASIGTALFISMGQALTKAGPGSMLIAFILQSIMLSMVNNCMAEMATYMPVSGGFIRLAGAWVDDAFGFMAGWNFFFYQAITIPFEITALNTVLSFWSDNIPPAAICAACIFVYACDLPKAFCVSQLTF